jgi:hypothetical protein
MPDTGRHAQCFIALMAVIAVKTPFAKGDKTHTRFCDKQIKKTTAQVVALEHPLRKTEVQ